MRCFVCVGHIQPRPYLIKTYPISSEGLPSWMLCIIDRAIDGVFSCIVWCSVLRYTTGIVRYSIENNNSVLISNIQFVLFVLYGVGTYYYYCYTTPPRKTLRLFFLRVFFPSFLLLSVYFMLFSPWHSLFFFFFSSSCRRLLSPRLSLRSIPRLSPRYSTMSEITHPTIKGTPLQLTLHPTTSE